MHLIRISKERLVALTRKMRICKRSFSIRATIKAKVMAEPHNNYFYEGCCHLKRGDVNEDFFGPDIL
jgi:hypothetical protein